MRCGVLVVLALAQLNLGCSKKEDDDPPSQEAIVAGKLDLSPAKAIAYVDTAVTTVMTESNVVDPIAGSISVTFNLDGDSTPIQDTNVPRCSNKTQAWDISKSSIMDRKDTQWPGREIYCKVNGNAGSPESVRGAYSSVKGVICAIEKAGLLKFSTAGETGSTKISITEECFGADYVASAKAEGFDGEFDVSFVMTTLDGSNGWEQKIAYTLEGQTDTVYLMTSDTTVSVARYSTEQGGFNLSLDAKNGILRYELTDPRNDRHVRLLGAGTVDLDTGALSSISRIEGIYSAEGAIGTVKGLTKEGFKAYMYESSGYDSASDSGSGESSYGNVTYASFSKKTDTCYGTSCTGNDGIAFDKEEYLSFAKFTSTLDLTSYGPLSFESVTLAEKPDQWKAALN